MTTTLAKFTVQSISHQWTNSPDDVRAIVTLAAVYGPGNEDWSQATPQGNIEMSITNPSAIEAFKIGKAYLISFKPVDVE